MEKFPLPREKARSTLAAILIPLLGIVSYLPAFHGGFVFDDHALIRGNELLRGPIWNIWSSTKAPDFWPLTYTSFWIEWRIWGEEAAGYHAVNVLLHVATALLLWRALEAMRVPGAWLAGILFAVHPVAVESVAWISERKNTLSGVLYLGTILAWLRLEDRPPIRRIPLCTFLFALSLLAKSSPIMLPVVLLGIPLYRRGTLARREWLETVPFFTLAVFLGLVTIWFQKENALGGAWGGQRGLWERIGGMGWALISYQKAAFLPMHLAFVYPEWPVSHTSPVFYLPGVALVALFSLLWGFRKRLSWVPGILYALAYHALFLLPVLGLLDIAYFMVGPVSNHLQYLALMGPVALIAYGTDRLSDRVPAAALAMAAGLTLVFSLSTYHRSSAFRDDMTLWIRTVSDSPRSAFARNYLAAFLLDKGRVPEALEQMNAAANLARDPGSRHRYRSLWHLHSGKKEEAIAEARQALRLGRNPEVRDEAASVLGAAGRVEEAVEVYRALAREFPNASGYSYTLAAALARSGRIPEAVDVLRTYCRRRPGDPVMEEALALTLLRLGMQGEALERAAIVAGVDAADPLAADQLARWAAKAGGK